MNLIATLLLLTTPAPFSVKLAWDASETPEVDKYFIYYGTASGTYSNKVDVGNNLLATIEGLNSETTYFFVATAYVTSWGLESDPSNEVSTTTPVYHPKLQLTASTIKFQSPPNDRWLLEETWDLKNWAGVATLSPTNGEVSYPITMNQPYRFYRATQIPRNTQTALTMVAASMFTILPAPQVVKQKRVYRHYDERKGAELLLQKRSTQIIGMKPEFPPLPSGLEIKR